MKKLTYTKLAFKMCSPVRWVVAVFPALFFGILEANQRSYADVNGKEFMVKDFLMGPGIVFFCVQLIALVIVGFRFAKTIKTIKHKGQIMIVKVEKIDVYDVSGLAFKIHSGPNRWANYAYHVNFSDGTKKHFTSTMDIGNLIERKYPIGSQYYSITIPYMVLSHNKRILRADRYELDPSLKEKLNQNQ